MKHIRKITLDDEVRYIRENGEKGVGYISVVKVFSKRLSNRDELTIGLQGSSLPQITYDDKTGRYFESNGAQIFIFPNHTSESEKPCQKDAVSVLHDRIEEFKRFSDNLITPEQRLEESMLAFKEKVQKSPETAGQRSERILAKRKTTRLYKILDHIRHNAYTGLTYGEIQKFIYEDIYKGRTYDPVKNRGTYGSNLSNVILPIYCKRTPDGKRWTLKPFIWGKKVMDYTRPLWKD